MTDTEEATALKYLPAVLSNQPDSSNRMLGPKTCLRRHQLDYTCGIVATSFAAWVDVTGAGKALLFGKVKRIHGQCLRKTLSILPVSNLATEGEAVMRS